MDGFQYISHIFIQIGAIFFIKSWYKFERFFYISLIIVHWARINTFDPFYIIFTFFGHLKILIHIGSCYILHILVYYWCEPHYRIPGPHTRWLMWTHCRIPTTHKRFDMNTKKSKIRRRIFFKWFLESRTKVWKIEHHKERKSLISPG